MWFPENERGGELMHRVQCLLSFPDGNASSDSTRESANEYTMIDVTGAGLRNGVALMLPPKKDHDFVSLVSLSDGTP